MIAPWGGGSLDQDIARLGTITVSILKIYIKNGFLSIGLRSSLISPLFPKPLFKILPLPLLPSTNFYPSPFMIKMTNEKVS